MNETLQNALAEIITAALENAGAAKEFVLAEMPDVVQQLLIWKMTISLIWFVFGLACLALIPLLLKHCLWLITERTTKDADWARSKNFTYFNEPSAAFVGNSILSVIGLALALLIGQLTINFEWLQIWLAPKVYLIEYAADLVK